MDLRGWWLAAAAAVPLGACAAALVVPSLTRVADLTLVAAGVACFLVLWTVGGRRERGLRGWRLIALSPLFPVLGALAAAVVAPADPVDVLVVRWIPSVPGYLLAIAGGLTLVDRSRFRGRGLRVGIELALFTTASMVAVQFLVLGAAGRWSDVPATAQFVLAAGVVATSLTMAGALTVLGVIESRRRQAAWLLLGGSIAVAAGRALLTSGLLHGSLAGALAGRALVVLGLAVVVAAVLSDPGRDVVANRPRTGASTRLGHLLPHLAMVVAMVVLAAQSLAGRPSVLTVLGVLLCVTLAAAHRWGTARDEQRLGAQLRRNEAYFRSLVQSSSDAVVLLDDDLRVSWSSPALAHVLGSAAADLLGRSLLAVVHPEDVADLSAALPTVSGTPTPADADRAAGLFLLRLRDAGGEWHVLEAVVSDQRADPSVEAVVLHCRDMTDRHAREQVLHSVAYSDPATGLPNRAGLLVALGRALESADRPVSLLLIELDGLQQAREHIGREEVRHVVAEIGRRLRATVRADDVVARMGSGAFAVMAHGADGDAPSAHAGEVDQLAARCLAVIERPVVTVDGMVDLTGSVGVVAGDAGLTVEEVLVRADLAARAARQDATGAAVRWTPALGAVAERRERLRRDLAGASDRGELFLLFEPIISLSERRVVGVEALLRWRHPQLGDIPPVEFLPLAERAGLAGELHRWVLHEAMVTTGAVSTPGEPIRLGVDLATGYVAAGTLVADVEAALLSTGFAPERLVLEIDDSAVLTGDERVGLDLATLRLMGVHVALQGFGSGSSALTHLTRLPIDVLKLDRSLVTQIDRDAQSRELCASVVGIGRSLGLDVVAEGVETPSQLAALVVAGSGFAQGFLISRPMQRAGLEELLADGVGALWPGLVGSQ